MITQNLETFGTLCAGIHQAAKHEPNDPKVMAAYDCLKVNLMLQYLALPVACIFTDQNPYKDSTELRTRVPAEGVLFVYSGGDLPGDHPLAEFIPERAINWNCIFRAVHDYIGHISGNNSFSYVGECRAFLAHAKTLPALAHGALAAETIAQNSWFNFGPYKHTPANERPFADQKAYVFPASIHTEVFKYV